VCKAYVQHSWFLNRWYLLTCKANRICDYGWIVDANHLYVMKVITFNSMGNAKNSKRTQVYELKKVMMKKKWRKGWNYYIPKGKNGGHLIRMFMLVFFFFLLWMTMENWQLMHYKSCIVCCVILILCFLLTQKKIKKRYNNLL
jgi:hypothetical protein